MSFLSSVRRDYLEWLEDSKYLVLNRFDKLSGSSDFFAVLCSKRGNDTYKRRIMARFGDLSRRLSKLVFFDPLSDFVEYSPAIWVTLTYDTKRCSLVDAWENLSKEFNNFRSKLQHRYGKMSLIRVFESTINGYPHIHAILVFHNYLFESEKIYSARHKRFIWRVAENKQIRQCWHSHVDVQAVSSMGSPMRYLRKYLSKSIDANKASDAVINTLALTWKFRKRSFALSSDLIKALHNSNPKRKIVTQTDLLGNNLNNIRVTVLGIVPSSLLAIKKDSPYFKLTPEQAYNCVKWVYDRQKT